MKKIASVLLLALSSCSQQGTEPSEPNRYGQNSPTFRYEILEGSFQGEKLDPRSAHNSIALLTRTQDGYNFEFMGCNSCPTSTFRVGPLLLRRDNDDTALVLTGADEDLQMNLVGPISRDSRYDMPTTFFASATGTTFFRILAGMILHK